MFTIAVVMALSIVTQDHSKQIKHDVANWQNDVLKSIKLEVTAANQIRDNSVSIRYLLINESPFGVLRLSSNFRSEFTLLDEKKRRIPTFGDGIIVCPTLKTSVLAELYSGCIFGQTITIKTKGRMIPKSVILTLRDNGILLKSITVTIKSEN